MIRAALEHFVWGRKLGTWAFPLYIPGQLVGILRVFRLKISIIHSEIHDSSQIMGSVVRFAVNLLLISWQSTYPPVPFNINGQQVCRSETEPQMWRQRQIGIPR